MSRHAISPEALSDLRRQLEPLPPRSAERRQRIQEAAAFYGVSEPTLYRLLRQRRQLRSLGRADRGAPRVLPKAELERYLEVIAALKVRTSNGKGRHLSTREAIRSLKTMAWTPPRGTCTRPKASSRRRRSTHI
jgi:transposase